MKIWVLSDLHQEFRCDPTASRHSETRFEPEDHAPADFDVVVLAGDIDVPLTASLRWIGERFTGVPVVAVAGNHDFYVGEGEAFALAEMRERGRDLAGELGIHLLDDSAIEIGGTRFLGGTLWTDFESIGRGNLQYKMYTAAGRHGMNDYRHIRRWSTKTPGKRKRIRPADTIAAHRVTRAFIDEAMTEPHAGPTVVVTHHAPHPRSLDGFYKGDLDWCYASDMGLTMEGETAPDLWLHGHIHRAQNYVVGRTRVVSNPRGYRFTSHEQSNDFDPGLVVEIGVPAPRPPGV